MIIFLVRSLFETGSLRATSNIAYWLWQISDPTKKI